MERYHFNKKQFKNDTTDQLAINLRIMEAKYYVAVRPRTNETHSIHKEGCPFLSADEKRIYLGIFRSGNDALIEGRHHFLNSSRCPFCSKETENRADRSMRYEEINTSQISSEIQMPVIYQSSMFCCVN